MVKRKLKGGGKTGILSPIPLPEVKTELAGNARNAAHQRLIHDSDYLTQLTNHTHGTDYQVGGGQCTGGAVPVAPSYGVPQGVGHMNGVTQTLTNYNNACQANENRIFDHLVSQGSSQIGGKIKKGTKRRKTNKRTLKKNHGRTIKKHHKKSIRRYRRTRKTRNGKK